MHKEEYVLFCNKDTHTHTHTYIYIVQDFLKLPYDHVYDNTHFT